MQTGAVGQPGVDHRRRAIEPQPERRDHALDDAHDRRGVNDAGHALDATVALDEHPMGTVHHDLGDRRVGDKRLERSQTADVIIN